MSRWGRIFIGVLWVVGAVTGVVLARAPGVLQAIPTPAFLVPLAAGLVLDLVIRSRSKEGVLDPVGMPQRGAGVIGAALIAFGASTLLAPG